MAKLDDYATVAERLWEFHQKHPEGIVTTEVVHSDDELVRFKAVVYRSQNVPLATGHAEEARNSRSDKVLEKCESTAVGRALALGGFSASKSIASREEMESFHASKGEVPAASNGSKAAEVETISAAEAAELEPLVRDWLGDDPDKREKLKLKLVSLGVTDPNAPLLEVLGQIPTAKKASELLSWMGKDNSLTPDEFADALIKEGVAVEKA